MKTIFISLILIIFTFSGLKAQQSIPVSGGQVSGATGTVSYTVGQVVYSSFSSDDGMINEGVQQPWEISVVSGIDVVGVDIELVAYPNPTTDRLNLKIDSDLSGFSYSLVDINGKLLQKDILRENQTVIDFQGYNPSVYLLNVFQDGKQVKSFKITKN